MSTPRHLHFGTLATDWVAAIPNELPIDAVGLWQVFAALKRGFGLEEPELTVWVRRSVEALLSAGALPVVGSAVDKNWHRAKGFGRERDTDVEAVLAYLRDLGREPHVGDLWFALPQFIGGASGKV